MGKFSSKLAERMRARRAAQDIRHPRGYPGMVMWCPRCKGEVMRAGVDHVATLSEQQVALARHDETCGARMTGG